MVEEPDLTEFEHLESFFHIDPHGGFYHIKAIQKLNGKDTGEFVSQLSLMIKEGTKDVQFDHRVEFGLRVFAGDKILFATSVSFQCENWYITYPGFPINSDWLSLNPKRLSKWFAKERWVTDRVADKKSRASTEEKP